MISLSNISKKYKHGILALDDVSVEFPNRGLVSLTGENGCGKTTLLNLIASIDSPTSGSIHYNNIEYKKINFRYLRNSIISYIQQENVFTNYLTVLDNVSITESNEDLINSNFEKFDIKDKLNKKSHELSGGQRQKCSFIRGIIKKSDVLLVDEPTSNMDKKTELVTFKLLKEISKKNWLLLFLIICN